jgi:hypothetical protein
MSNRKPGSLWAFLLHIPRCLHYVAMPARRNALIDAECRPQEFPVPKRVLLALARSTELSTYGFY